MHLNKPTKQFTWVILLTLPFSLMGQAVSEYWILNALSKRYGVIEERHTIGLTKIQRKAFKDDRDLKTGIEHDFIPAVRKGREDYKKFQKKSYSSELDSAIKAGTDNGIDTALDKIFLNKDLIDQAKSLLPQKGQKDLPGSKYDGSRFAKAIAKRAREDVQAFLIQEHFESLTLQEGMMGPDSIMEPDDGDVDIDKEVAKILNVEEEEDDKEKIVKAIEGALSDYDDYTKKEKSEESIKKSVNLKDRIKAFSKRARPGVVRLSPPQTGESSGFALKKFDISEYQKLLGKQSVLLNDFNPNQGKMPDKYKIILNANKVKLGREDLMNALANTLAAYNMLAAYKSNGGLKYNKNSNDLKALAKQAKEIAYVIAKLKQQGDWDKLGGGFGLQGPIIMNDDRREVRPRRPNPPIVEDSPKSKVESR